MANAIEEMSSVNTFHTDQKVDMTDLFCGRLEQYGIREEIADGTTESKRCLTDGHNFIWVYGDEMVERLTRPWSSGPPVGILRAIAEEFQTELYSEYEPQFGRDR
ncbi:MAG: hypothetical protein U5Q16_10365 [Gammaproteobacteria bacterium]|nr:hypothetical protein [Gammaproteobacteria bacterium]